MTNLLNLEPWWRFGVALLIGALIGLEREFIQQKEGQPDFAGIRTFSLIALLGAVTAHLAADFGLQLVIVTLGGLILLSVASYLGSVLRAGTEEGITTEVAVLLTFLLGALVIWDQPELAGALAVITALLLSLKGSLHEAIRRMSADDLRTTLEFGLVAAVVLPLLPNRTVDPFDVLNPFQVWLLVVFISGIGFGGYILMKVLGAERGIILASLLGGVVSSTATTISFATRSKETPALSPQFAQAILLASSVMFPRVLVVVLALYPPLLRFIAFPLLVMLITGLALAYLLHRRHHLERGDDEREVTLSNPLKLSTAIGFGLLFAFVLVIVRLAQTQFGSAGVYVASLITGLTGVDAITLSVTDLASNARLEGQVAGIAIIIASLMNTISKGGIVYLTGAPELRRTILRALGLIVLVGLAAGGIALAIG
jgi:uncharacterized membrane protein (DUF4010 family)